MSRSNGAAFACRRCGECCRGRGGIILDSRDQERLAAHLGLTRRELLDQYAEERGGKHHLRVDENECCVFQRGTDCGVHQARPDICRAWPFFRGNLVDASSWELAQDYCPGLNRRVDHAEFVRQGMVQLKEQGLVRDASEPWPEDRAEALRFDLKG